MIASCYSDIDNRIIILEIDDKYQGCAEQEEFTNETNYYVKQWMHFYTANKVEEMLAKPAPKRYHAPYTFVKLPQGVWNDTTKRIER